MQASLGCSLHHPQQSAHTAACAVCVTAQNLRPATAFLCPRTGSPHSHATRVAATERVRRSLQRRAEPSTGEPQPLIPRWEEQGRLLEAQQGCRSRAEWRQRNEWQRGEMARAQTAEGGTKHNRAAEKREKRRRQVKEPVMSISFPMAPGADI